MKGFDILLTDLDEKLLNTAHAKGVKHVKRFDLLEEVSSPQAVFDVVVMKSVQHEFQPEKLKVIHKNIYDLLNKDGIFLEWDVHVESEGQASWLKKYINLKDSLAGDIHLVDNRHIYTSQQVIKNLIDTGFREIRIVYRFHYSISNNKFSEVYFRTASGEVDENKKEIFYQETMKLIQELPQGIRFTDDEKNHDLIFKIPAVIIKASK